MIHFRKKRTPDPQVQADIDEARKIREQVQAQWPAVLEGLEFLSARHQQNGFGDKLQVTFQPKRKHP